jgi:hypothetical protein
VTFEEGGPHRSTPVWDAAEDLWRLELEFSDGTRRVFWSTVNAEWALWYGDPDDAREDQGNER